MASPIPLDAPVTIAARADDMLRPLPRGERNRCACPDDWTARVSIPHLAGSVCGARTCREARERGGPVAQLVRAVDS